MSELPKTFEYCIRCNKEVSYGAAHICRPAGKYLAGMREGEMIQRKLNEALNDKYEKAIRFIEIIADDKNEGFDWHEDANELLRELSK